MNSQMMCPADGPTSGRHEKIIRKVRRQKGRDRELKVKQKNRRSYVRLVGQGRHNRLKEDTDRRTKRNNKISKNK